MQWNLNTCWERGVIHLPEIVIRLPEVVVLRHYLYTFVHVYSVVIFTCSVRNHQWPKCNSLFFCSLFMYLSFSTFTVWRSAGLNTDTLVCMPESILVFIVFCCCFLFFPCLMLCLFSVSNVEVEVPQGAGSLAWLTDWYPKIHFILSKCVCVFEAGVCYFPILGHFIGLFVSNGSLSHNWMKWKWHLSLTSPSFIVCSVPISIHQYATIFDCCYGYLRGCYLTTNYSYK